MTTAFMGKENLHTNGRSRKCNTVQVSSGKHRLPLNPMKSRRRLRYQPEPVQEEDIEESVCIEEMTEQEQLQLQR